MRNNTTRICFWKRKLNVFMELEIYRTKLFPANNVHCYCTRFPVWKWWCSYEHENHPIINYIGYSVYLSQQFKNQNRLFCTKQIRSALWSLPIHCTSSIKIEVSLGRFSQNIWVYPIHISFNLIFDIEIKRA